MISVTSLAASDADSNTTADTIHEDNKLSNITANEENWTDVNLNEETEQKNMHNMQIRGAYFNSAGSVVIFNDKFVWSMGAPWLEILTSNQIIFYFNILAVQLSS